MRTFHFLRPEQSAGKKRPPPNEFPREVAEMALAHAVSDKVEAAYCRGDLFQKRRQLMEGWAKFCARPKANNQHCIDEIVVE
jgi:hypothetical protein